MQWAEPVTGSSSMPGAVARYCQWPASGMEGDAVAGLRQPIEQDPGGGQRGVAAEIDLDQRREPSQVKATIVARHDKGGFREIVLQGDRLHRGLGQPLAQWHHRRGIATKGAVGEGVDLVETQLHSAFQPSVGVCGTGQWQPGAATGRRRPPRRTSPVGRRRKQRNRCSQRTGWRQCGIADACVRKNTVARCRVSSWNPGLASHRIGLAPELIPVFGKRVPHERWDSRLPIVGGVPGYLPDKPDFVEPIDDGGRPVR